MDTDPKRIVKHAPPKTNRGVNAVYINSNTPFVSAVKRVTKMLDHQRKRRDTPNVLVCGLGKAITRTIALAMELMEANYRVEIRTKTVEAVDEQIDLDQGSNNMEKRYISCVELRIRPSRGQAGLTKANA